MLLSQFCYCSYLQFFTIFQMLMSKNESTAFSPTCIVNHSHRKQNKKLSPSWLLVRFLTPAPYAAPKQRWSGKNRQGLVLESPPLNSMQNVESTHRFKSYPSIGSVKLQGLELCIITVTAKIEGFVSDFLGWRTEKTINRNKNVNLISMV